MSEQRRRGRAWKPDATGKRCARTWNEHVGIRCYAVPDPAIDAFDPPRSELLEVSDGADAPAGSRRAVRRAGCEPSPREEQSGR
jgi:hypothetical protein